MKKKLIVFILAGLALTSSCKNEKEEIITYPGATTFDNSSIKRIKLSNPIQLPLDPVIEPYFYEAYDSLLIITGKIKENSKLIHIYNLNNCQKITSFANTGRGPNEFMMVQEFQILPATNEIYVPDVLGQVSRLYSIDSLLSGSADSSIDEISFHGTKFNGIRKLDSDLYLCNYGRYHIPGDFMLTTIVVPSLTITDSIYYPLSLDDNKPQSPISNSRSIFSNSCSYNSKVGRIVLAYSNTDLLEVYDKELNRISRIHGPDRFLPIWEELGINVSTVVRGKSRRGYSSPIAVEGGFYVLYSGETWSVDENAAPKNNGLYFFDYNGIPKLFYTFDMENVSVCRSNQNEKMIIVLDNHLEFFLYNINK